MHAPSPPGELAVDDTQGEDTAAGSLLSTGAAPGEAAAALPRGAAIGRYVVLARLGAGGMGVVYSAYDPELDRKVAVKLLKSGGDDPIASARLLREAQAMAKIAHPNVIAVYDVGTHGGEVFVAMEFVQGQTLAQRLAARPHGWQEIVELFTAVGRGLQAVHRAGLVHRDLKPENVMIGADGRVRVMDFGLAHTDVEALLQRFSRPLVLHEQAITPALTPSGALLGTPAYMAPEQWFGGAVDARSDLFSFCVAFWEALHGVRPYRGGSLSALVAALREGAIAAPSRPGRAPAWLRRILERGLAIDPAARYPTLDALLDALASRPARARRLKAIAGAAAIAALIGGIVGARALGHVRAIAACEAEGADLRASMWSPESQADLRAAFLRSGLSYAAETHDKLVPWVDAWVDAWARMRARSCTETEVTGTRPAELHALAVACLDERRGDVEELLERLHEGDPTAIARAVSAASSLPRLEPCEDPAALRRRPPLPRAGPSRARYMALRREYSQVRSLQLAGRYRDALRRAEPLRLAAESLETRALRAEVDTLAGILYVETGRYEEAQEALRRAFLDAGALGMDEVAAAAAMNLAFTLGYKRGRHDEGLAWAAAAEMLVRRLGMQDTALGASFATNLALVEQARGRYDEAQALFERVREIRVRTMGADHPTVGGALNNLAELHRARGELTRALELQEQALTIRERSLGPDHPRVALSLHNLGLIRRTLGDLDGAEALHQRALATWERALGPTHPDVGRALVGLAAVALDRGAPDLALAHLARAGEVWGERAGPEDLAELRFEMARALWAIAGEQGRDVARARALASEAADLLRRAGDGQRARLAAVEQWLADHPG